jgi:hypothetical protein
MKFSPILNGYYIWGQDTLLDNNQLEKVEKLEGNWLQKKIAQPNTERIAINRVLNNKNSFKPVVNFYRTMC